MALLNVLSPFEAAFAQTRWTNQTPDLMLMLEGNGRYVAAGEIIQTSTDALDWQSLQEGPFYFLRAGAFGNGTFLLSSFNKMLISTNGVHWRESSSFTFSGITFFGQRFFAVGNPNGDYGPAGCYWSPDGSDWQESLRPPFPLAGLASGNGTMVSYALDSGTISHFFVSTNGTNWSDRSFPSEKKVSQIGFTGSLFYGLTRPPDVPALLISSNALDWTSVLLPETNLLTSVVQARGRYFAIAAFEKVLSSTNALDWRVEQTFTNQYLRGAIETADGLLLFGAGGFLNLRQGEEDWLNVRPSLPTLSEFWKAAFWRRAFYASGYGVARSSNGMQWTELFSTGTNWIVSMVPTASESALLAFREDGYVYEIGTNGWQLNAIDPMFSPRTVARFGQRWIAAGSSEIDSPSTSIYSSEDGMHWTRRFSHPYQNIFLLAAGNGVMIASGDHWQVGCPASGPCQLPDPSVYPPEDTLISTNGIDWVYASGPAHRPPEALAFGNGRFVAVQEEFTGSDWTYPTYISTNGLDWLRNEEATALPTGLTFQNGEFLMLHFSGVSTSSDGIQWNFHAANYYGNSSRVLSDLVYGSHMYIGVGGLLITAPEDYWTTIKRASPTTVEIGVSASVGQDISFEETTNLIQWVPRPDFKEEVPLPSGSSARFFRAVIR